MDEVLKEIVLTCKAVREWLAAHPQLPLVGTPVAAIAVEAQAPARRTRKPKAEAQAPAPADATDGMFPPETPAAPAAAPKSNAQVIADTAAKCQELVGTFIRRLNHHTPNTGLKAAQQIVTEIAPACVGKKIEEWAHGDRLKIIARMEQELGQVEAQV